MSVYVGIDVHRKRSQVAVVTGDGQVLVNKNVVNGSEPFLRLIGDLPPGTPVAFEAAYGWGWLAGLLEDYGFEAHLVHPLRCKAIASARLKNDKVDAAIKRASGQDQKAYDVVLYDYKQEVDRLPKALAILNLTPNPSLHMEVSGSFKNLDVSTAKQFQPGQKLTNGANTAEVLRVGPPVPSVFRLTAGSTVMSMQMPGQVELPAAVRVNCYTDVGVDGSVRCLVPGPVHAAPVAPDSMLTLPGPQGWVAFQIATVALPAAPALVMVRASFHTRSEIARIVKVGERDTTGRQVPEKIAAR